jgi:hypothetical protein
MQPDSTSPSTGTEDGSRLGRRAEFAVVWGACLIAALRVFVFAAAFPFFSNIDEQAHFDLVLRYVHGGAPTGIAPFSGETAEYIALYSSPEYIVGPEKFPGGKIPPPTWMMPRELASVRFQGLASLWRSQANHEAPGSPLYHPAAALWWRIGKACGLEGGFLLYWLRFLNVFFGAGLVWLGYWAARLVFTGRSFPRLAVALLLAFYPQDIFYSIQSDVFSPALFGLAFIGLIKLWRAEMPGVGLAVFTGAAIAGAALVKATNLPLLAVSALAVLGKAWQLARAGKLRASFPALGLLALCALLPVGAWMLWNQHTFGDLTATAQKTRAMGWTPKPLSQWWPHPLFSLHGQKEFWGELLASFWRGEFCWRSQRLASPLADTFYCVSSLVFLAANLPALVRRKPGVARPERAVLWMAMGSFVAVAAFLALSSIAFDFGQCEYPSREHPFFTSGRLMAGALIPFLLLYARGLDRLLGWRGNRWAWPAGLAAILVLITVSELAVNRPAFSSLYNFFHLPPFRAAAANVPALYLRP